MQDLKSPKNIQQESPYYPWASLIIEICGNEDFNPAETIRRFWDRYTLPECTLPLYQLLLASKGKATGNSPDDMAPYLVPEETPDTWLRDLCEALIAFSYLTRFAREQIIFVKPQTAQPDANR